MSKEKKEGLKISRYTIFIVLIGVLILLLGSTYAFFTYYKMSDAFVITSNSITATFEEGTNVIDFQNAYPISDNYALQNLDKLSYIDFTISSTSSSNESITHEIFLSEEDGNTLSSDYVKLYLVNNDTGVQILGPSIYSNLNYTTYSESSTGRVIYKESSIGEFTKSYRLYAWVDSTYEQNEVSQIFSFRVNLYAYNS